MAQNGIVNLDSAKQEIQYALLRKVGITDEQLASIPKEKLKFNEEYSYLALTDGSIELLDIIKSEETISAMKEQIALYRAMDPQKLETTISQMEKMLNAPENRKLISKEMIQQNLDLIDMYRNIDQYTDEEIINKAFAITRFAINKIGNTDCINTVIREAVLGNFKEYIFDESNIYGQTNAKTKAAYEEAGLNYNQWLNPEIKDVELNVAGKQLTIKLWDRNPQEDLFIGNKTSCCTAIGTGSNAGSTPIYLLNTSFNVVELYDASGNAVAMSRVYMGKIDGQSVLLMDNYEINSAFAKDLTMEQKGEIRDGFFEYMNQYAQAITGNPNTQVYLYPEGDNSRFPAGDLTERKAITEFTGNVSQETVYINASGFQWINTDKMEDIGKIKWLIVPKLN